MMIQETSLSSISDYDVESNRIVSSSGVRRISTVSNEIVAPRLRQQIVIHRNHGVRKKSVHFGCTMWGMDQYMKWPVNIVVFVLLQFLWSIYCLPVQQRKDGVYRIIWWMAGMEKSSSISRWWLLALLTSLTGVLCGNETPICRTTTSVQIDKNYAHRYLPSTQKHTQSLTQPILCTTRRHDSSSRYNSIWDAKTTNVNNNNNNNIGSSRSSVQNEVMS